MAYLNTATLFTSTPNWNVKDEGAEPDTKSVKGRSGTRIVFSWTWNEKRKNDMEDANRAYGRSGKMGTGGELVLSPEVKGFSLAPTL